MSYILDALRKAAEQRERQAPVLRRLLSAAPPPRSVRLRFPRRFLAVAVLLNVGLLSVLMVIWLRPVTVVAPREAATTASSSAPPAAPEPQPGPPVRANRPRQGEPDGIVGSPASPPATTTRSPQASPVEPRTMPTVAPPHQSASVTAHPRLAPPTEGAPKPAVTPPVPPPVAPTPPKLAGLKLEALVYSPVREQRLIFVNGRKYVEGDAIEGRLRVEEIRENSVTLSEQGQRFTVPFQR